LYREKSGNPDKYNDQKNSFQLLSGQAGVDGQGPEDLSGVRKAGIDFTKLHFGRKLFGQIFILKFWTNLQPKKTARITFSDY
jgi:hypothetical protein